MANAMNCGGFYDSNLRCTYTLASQVFMNGDWSCTEYVCHIKMLNRKFVEMGQDELLYIVLKVKEQFIDLFI